MVSQGFSNVGKCLKVSGFILNIRINACIYIYIYIIYIYIYHMYRICNCISIYIYIYTCTYTRIAEGDFPFSQVYSLLGIRHEEPRGWRLGDESFQCVAAHVDVYLCANVPNNLSSLKRYMEVAQIIAEFHWMICREYLRTISQHGKLMKTHPVIRKKQLAGRAFFFSINMAVNPVDLPSNSATGRPSWTE